MIIVGLKLTHDAHIAVIEDDRLVGCTELEKVDNAPRYTPMPNMECVTRILKRDFGLVPTDVDRWVLDGWKRRLLHVGSVTLPVAPYHETDPPTQPADLITRVTFPEISHSSYRHVAGHVVGSYVVSPFAGQPAWVCCWDGGMQPRVYRVDGSAPQEVPYAGRASELYGCIYTVMGAWLGPWRDDTLRAYTGDNFDAFMGKERYEVPGKLMAYMSQGQVHDELMDTCEAAYHAMLTLRHWDLDGYRHNWNLENEFLRYLVGCTEMYADVDVLRTLHAFLQRQLIEGLSRLVPRNANLIFTGGAALNIKWNSALRECGQFGAVWVPPFPNDCGTAIGAAACERGRLTPLTWDVFSGPLVQPTVSIPDGWRVTPMGPAQLGEWLATYEHCPVVVLYGHAELGPRALGHRSLLAAATTRTNHATLNRVKGREAFRPVAPICLESFAPEVFSPGTPDPYMLFEHTVRPDWAERVPAIVHLDGSARLQTVTASSDPIMSAILCAYQARTGIGLLCNTSANFHGKGFFPDVASAMAWDHVPHIWSEGVFYEKIGG